MTFPPPAPRAALRAGTCFALALSVLGCTQASDDPGVAAAREKPASFTEEDKRAAMALSIGSGVDPGGNTSPYEQALRCSLAFRELSTRFADLGAAAEQQGRAMAQAEAMFDQRLERAAAQAGRSARQIADDRAKLDAELPEGTERARIAIACIRELQVQLQGV
jgi:hypothetical protein